MFCRSWRHTLSDNQEAGHGVTGAKIGPRKVLLPIALGNVVITSILAYIFH